MNNYKNFRYIRRLFEKDGCFAIDNHFYPNYEEFNKNVLSKHTFSKYVHMP